MGTIQFPPIQEATEEGLLAFGGDLSVSSLLLAYRQGIFPWPLSAKGPLAWFSPDPRGVLYTKDVHLSRSLQKTIRKGIFQVSFNQNFSQVIRNCASTKRKGQQGTWMSPELIDAYEELHRQGHAYSIEAFCDGQLAGGLYGVCIGHFLSGESMFYIQSNASKICLFTLMEKLKRNNISFLDTQMLTPATLSFGACEMPRDQFIKELAILQKMPSLNW